MTALIKCVAVTAFILCVVFSIKSQVEVKTVTSKPTAVQESELRFLVRQYVTAFARNDWESISPLVSSQTKDMADRRDLAEGALTKQQGLVLDTLQVERISIENIRFPGKDDWSEIRASVYVTVSPIGTQSKLFSSLFNVHRIIECIYEKDQYWWDGRYNPNDGPLLHHASSVKQSQKSPPKMQWRILGDFPDPAFLLQRLEQTSSDDDLRTLISLETSESVRRLAKAFEKKGVELLEQGQRSAASHSFQMAHRLSLQRQEKTNSSRSVQYERGLKDAEAKLASWKRAMADPNRNGGPPNLPGDDSMSDLNWNICNVHFRFINFDKALACYRSTLDSMPADVRRHWDSNFLYERIADSYERKRDFQSAANYYLQSIDARRARGENDHFVAGDLLHVGDLYLLLDNHESALNYYFQSKKTFEDLVEKRDKKSPTKYDTEISGLWESVRSIFRLYLWRHDTEKALRFYEQTANEYFGSSDVDLATYQFMELGILQLSLNRTDEAISTFERLLQIYRTETPSDEVRSNIALVEFLLGEQYFIKGENSRAIESLTKAENDIPAKPNYPDDDLDYLKDFIDLFIGVIYSSQGDTTLDEHIADAFTSKYNNGISTVWSHAGNVVGTLIRLGDLYAQRRKLDVALDCYRSALGYSQEKVEKLLVVDRLSSLGDEFLRSGDLKKSVEVNQQALDLSRQYSSVGKIEPEDFSWGAGWEFPNDSLFNPNLTDPLYRQLLQRRREDKWNTFGRDRSSPPEIMLHLADANKQSGNVKIALENYKQAVEDERLPLEAKTNGLLQISRIYQDRRDYNVARTYADQARQFANASRAPDLIFDANVDYGNILRGLADTSGAREAFQAATRTLELSLSQAAGTGQEQQFLLHDRLAAYYSLIDLLISEGDSPAALQNAEVTKARVLRAMLAGRLTDSQIVMSHSEQKTNDQLVGRLKFLSQQMSQTEDQHQRERISNDFQRARLTYEIFRLKTFATHSEQLRKESPQPDVSESMYPNPDEDTAFVEYVVGESNAYLFVITNTKGKRQVNSFTLDLDRKNLETKVNKFRALIENKSNNFRSSAIDLYNALLAKAEPLLTGKSRIVLVPDGILWTVPFQALETRAGHYLIEDFVISYAPSLLALKQIIERRDENVRKKGIPGSTLSGPLLLAVGNPNVPPSRQTRVQKVVNQCQTRSEFHAIPEAEDEVNQIVSLYGAAATGSISYTRSSATEEMIKRESQRYKILHLATHGVLDNQSPMDSYILLAPNKAGGVGSLNAREMMTLNLQAELVVLSACETAEGRVGDGEGMIGMTWALTAAGTPTVVASQWQVNSCSTTDLMVAFHRGLRDRVMKGESTLHVAEALQKASLTLMKQDEYQHPFYWAGFIVVGDGR
jgi:CHAT domain-containing protein